MERGDPAPAAATPAADAAAGAQTKALAILRSLVGLSLLQRGSSLLLAMALLARAPAESYGFANVQLELFLSTLLFLAREGIRLALLRWNLTPDPSHASFQRFVRASWIEVALCAAMAVAGALRWHWSAGLAPVEAAAVWMIGIGATLETAAEPWANVLQARLMPATRFRAESRASFAKLAVVCTGVFALDPALAPAAFGFGQLVYGAVVLGVFVAETEALSPTHRVRVRDVTRHFMVLDRALLRELAAPALVFSAQSVLKHILTEADKIVLAGFASRFDQGVYAASSKPGVAARTAAAAAQRRSGSLHVRALGGRRRSSRRAGRDLCLRRARCGVRWAPLPGTGRAQLRLAAGVARQRLASVSRHAASLLLVHAGHGRQRRVRGVRARDHAADRPHGGAVDLRRLDRLFRGVCGSRGTSDVGDGHGRPRAREHRRHARAHRGQCGAHRAVLRLGGGAASRRAARSGGAGRGGVLVRHSGGRKRCLAAGCGRPGARGAARASWRGPWRCAERPRRWARWFWRPWLWRAIARRGQPCRRCCGARGREAAGAEEILDSMRAVARTRW
jgi:hypothetical protein